MTATPETFKAAWITDLKAHPLVISPVIPKEVREVEYQSQDWVYPCIRVAIEFLPSRIYCGPDAANVEIQVYTEQKSSKQAAEVASAIFEQYHGHPFTIGTTRFSAVVVRSVSKPDRTIYAWVITVNIYCEGVTT